MTYWISNIIANSFTIYKTFSIHLISSSSVKNLAIALRQCYGSPLQLRPTLRLWKRLLTPFLFFFYRSAGFPTAPSKYIIFIPGACGPLTPSYIPLKLSKPL